LPARRAPRSDVERLRELIAAERAPMPHVAPVPLTDSLVELVKAGLVAIVSRWAVAPWLARGEIVARRLTRTGHEELEKRLLCQADASAAPWRTANVRSSQCLHRSDCVRTVKRV